MILSEKKILEYIKIIPIILTISLSIVFIIFLNHENYVQYNKVILDIKTKFIQENRTLIKKENKQINNLIKIYKDHEYKEVDSLLKNNMYISYSLSTEIFNLYKKDNRENILSIISALNNTIISLPKNTIFFYLEEINSRFTFSNKKYFSKKYIMNKKEDFYKYTDLKVHYQCYYKYSEKYNILQNTCMNMNKIDEQIKYDLLNKILLITKNSKHYLFILDKNKRFIFHRNESFINKDIDHNTIDRVVNAANNSDSYISYNNFTYNNGMKTSYVNKVKDFNWILGIGFEHESLNKEIELYTKNIIIKSNDEMLHISLISFLLIILSFLISYKASKILEKKFLKYKNDLNNQILLRKQKEFMLLQQSKMSIMGEMISYISHQWKQPLNRINGINYLISMNIKDKKTKTYLSEIENNTKYLSETIDYFSNFFNPNQNKTNFNISSIIKKSLVLLDSRIKKHNIKINIYSPKEINIFSKEQEYIQVLLIVLNNSIDNFIIKETKKPIILITTLQVQNFILLSIEDNGGGINIENINDIFDIWFTTKENNNGAGLGLYMAKFIIENSMNGHISVKEKNNNTIFKIYTKDNILE